MNDKLKTTVYWSYFTYDGWKFFLAKTEQGLCYVGSPNKPFSELENWVSRKISEAELAEDSSKLTKDIEQIKQYLSGDIKVFNLPVDKVGTSFQKSVWQAAERIAYGSTNTYKNIAEKINNPKAVRAVGTAIGANPLLIIVPCHRVIAKNGGLSGFRGGLDMKELLLSLEKQHS